MSNPDLNLTLNEKIMLQMIACNCYASSNYEEPETFDDCGSPWTNLLDDCQLKKGMKMPAKSSFGGIVNSLVKKGLVEATTEFGRDNTTSLTPEGFKAWQEQVQKVDFTK